MTSPLTIAGVLSIISPVVVAEQLPTEDELQVLNNRFWNLRRGQDGLVLTRPEQQTLHRCWHFVRRQEAPVLTRRVCRNLLLFAHGLVTPTEHLHPEKCEQWAFLAAPDRTLLYEDLLGKFASDGQRQGFWPPLLSRPGGIVFDVGGGTRGETSEENILPFRPRQLHLFEVVPAYAERLAAYFAGKGNVSIHPYGLGRLSQGDLQVVLAGWGTSLFHNVQFSGHRMYLDTVGDEVHGRLRNERAAVNVRSIADVWRELGVRRLALLHMNCEGCEYEVVPALAEAGLLTRVEIVVVAEHFVLSDDEAPTCDLISGTCELSAAMLAIDRYCRFRELLSRSHRRVLGIPLRSERWELRAAPRRR